jgi:K+-transporting ATPase ATPase A chain
MRWLEYIVFLGIVVGSARPVGLYLARVFERQHTFADPMLRPVERALHRLLGVRADHEMTAGVYLFSFLAFSAAGTILLIAILLCQQWLPGGPADAYLKTEVKPDLAANTAISFSTTTTWQAYSGESTLRYAAQLIGLAAQNFLGAAAGLAVGMAFIRGFARDKASTLGNFWVDLIRGLLWVLLPASVIGSLFLVWQGVPLNFAPYVEARTVQGSMQTIARGPVAAL